MNQWILTAAILPAVMLLAADKTAYVCKFCGETFSGSTAVRTGYCTYSANHRHLAVQTNGTCVCQFCGEKFSSPSSVRTGYCMYSENHRHALSSAARGTFFCKYCGEKFSSPTGVRTGTCQKNEKTHRHCLP